MSGPGDFLNHFDPQVDQHPRPGEPASPSPRSLRFRWVPIRSLAARHRHRIEAHLLALDPDDRYLRFGFPASDAQIHHYVQSIRFDRDEVFGIFNRRLQLIALAHLADEPVAQQLPGRPTMAEFGVSVLASARGRSYGSRLFDHAVMHARNRGIDRLYIHALSENHAMLRIARNAGAQVKRDGGESQAWLHLEPDTLGSQVGAMVEAQAAEMNYQLKRHALRLGEFFEGMQELKQQIGRGSPGSP